MKYLIISTLVALSLQAKAETYKELKALAFSESQEMGVRWKSLIKMSQMKQNESLLDLKKALNSSTWYMRNAALLAIDSINPEIAYAEAKKQLQDPALVVRSGAVDILVKSKKNIAETRDLLWKELSDKKNRVKTQSLWIRSQISQYLAENPIQNERTKFLALLNDTDEDVKVFAKKALDKF